MIQFGVIARTFSSSSAVQNAVKNVTVIGGGLMGSGIAQVSKFFCCLRNTNKTVAISNLHVVTLSVSIELDFGK